MAPFLCFEGIDGSGKTTQWQMLRDWLEQRGIAATATREPGGTALAEAMRHHLLHATTRPVPRAELLLFGAARAQHVEEIIRPALGRGEWVLCDRFTDSSLAYQGGGLGLDMSFIRAMNRFATASLLADEGAENSAPPHLTLLFDVPLEISVARRRAETADHIEARGVEFLARVREAFLELAAAEPQRMVLIDATAEPAEIHRRVLEVLQERGVLAPNLPA